MSASADARVLRILLAKVGLDGHDRGVRMLARELVGRGCEVVLLGTGSTAPILASIARDEDVDVIGISILSGAHRTLIPKVVAAMREAHLDIPVVCGGTIPTDDAAWLRTQGVSAVCPVGTPLTAAADAVVAAAAGHANSGGWIAH